MSSSAEPRQTPQAPQRGDLQVHVDLSTSQSTPPQTLPANIPAQAFQDACELLMMIIRPENDDSRIRRFLDIVRIAVHTALKQHPELKERLADEAGFLDNVKRKGEQEFFDSLRAMAKSGTWTALFEDGTLFSFFGSHYSDHLLCLDVFLNARKENLNTTFVSGT
jgi:hypothetical protein